MYYYPNDVYIGRSLELYGEFSEEEIRLFEKIISPTDVAVDVGANIGTHTVALSRLARDVWALEPQKSVFDCLCANIAVNGLRNVHCLHLAAGRDARSIAVPQIDPDTIFNFGGLELFHDWSASGHNTAMISVIPLDTLALPACDFIKIDVEGMELEVLEGAAETIARAQPILYVENDRAANQAALITYLKSLGYHIWPHQPHLYSDDNFFGNPCNVFGEIVSLNLLCTPMRGRRDIRADRLGLIEM